MKIAVVNGPNLNLLGKRETDIYGTMTLAAIENLLGEKAREAGVEIQFFQSNSEGAIIDYIQGLEGEVDGLIINPAALTHYSVALRDALTYLTIPIIEVHLSNIYSREPFRHVSLTAPVVTGQLSGMGHIGYVLALQGLIALVKSRQVT
ncbi:MAG: type II 3-dehydroquinate dehydratase [Chloroflexota bacterium]